MNIFNNIKKLDYKKYFYENKLDTLFPGIVINFEKKTPKPLFVYENNDKEPYQPEFKDLARLHYLIRVKKITTVLEFGVGYSSIVMAHALNLNKKDYSEYVSKNLRRTDAFKLFSVDTDNKYIKYVKKNIPKQLKNNIIFSFSTASMTTFNSRICAQFDELPNICPDFIYVDAPCFMHVKKNINGIHTRHPDRTIIACDVLKIESLLLPGTLILWDGQTNNARFTEANFQRKWKTKHFYDLDITLSEQIESPLGPYNKRQLEFSS